MLLFNCFNLSTLILILFITTLLKERGSRQIPARDFAVSYLDSRHPYDDPSEVRRIFYQVQASIMRVTPH